MRLCLLALCFCVLFAVPASAQVNPVPAGRPLNLHFLHKGDPATTFQCYVDGKPVGARLQPSDRVCVLQGGLSEGTHTVAVEALNFYGTSKSADLQTTAGSAPEPPTGLRLELIVTIAKSSTGDAEIVSASIRQAP